MYPLSYLLSPHILHTTYHSLKLPCSRIYLFSVSVPSNSLKCQLHKRTKDLVCLSSYCFPHAKKSICPSTNVCLFNKWLNKWMNMPTASYPWPTVSFSWNVILSFTPLLLPLLFSSHLKAFCLMTQAKDEIKCYFSRRVPLNLPRKINFSLQYPHSPLFIALLFHSTLWTPHQELSVIHPSASPS